MALDTTLGGSHSNSYVDLDEANEFFANHYSIAKSETWAALTDPQKEAALKRACSTIDGLRVLDNEIGYGPLPLALIERDFYDLTVHRLMMTQVLNFPRNIDVDMSNVGFIPQDVKDAQCEQAIYLLTFDESAIATRLSGVYDTTTSAGPVRVHESFRNGGTMIAPMAIELMRKYFRSTARVKRS